MGGGGVVYALFMLERFVQKILFVGIFILCILDEL